MAPKTSSSSIATFRVPQWLLEELSRLNSAFSQQQQQQKSSASSSSSLARDLLPIFLFGIPSVKLSSSVQHLVGLALLPNASRDQLVMGEVASSQQKKEQQKQIPNSIAALVPCCFSQLRVLSSASELSKFLKEESKPIEQSLLDTIKATASLTVCYVPSFLSSSRSHSSSGDLVTITAQSQELQVLDQQQFQSETQKEEEEEEEEMDGKIKEFCSSRSNKISPGRAEFCTVTTTTTNHNSKSQQQQQQEEQNASSQSVEVIFKIPLTSSKAVDPFAAELIDTTTSSSSLSLLDSSRAQQKWNQKRFNLSKLNMNASSSSSSSSSSARFDVFWPPLQGQWCPLVAPCYPPQLRYMVHRMLLLPPCPHLLPGHSLLGRLCQNQAEKPSVRKENTKRMKMLRKKNNKRMNQDDFQEDESYDDDEDDGDDNNNSEGKKKKRRNNEEDDDDDESDCFTFLSALNQSRVTPELVGILVDPHLSIRKTPAGWSEDAEPNCLALVRGSYSYYHYKIDGFDDKGWGCAYRSLQTCLSWFARQCDFDFGRKYQLRQIPSLRQIQEILFEIDPEKMKMKNFVGSSTWIGSYEVMMVLSFFIPGLESKIIRVERGSDFVKNASLARQLVMHFERSGCPVMIGGAQFAHTILGIQTDLQTGELQLLILDPHFCGTNNNNNNNNNKKKKNENEKENNMKKANTSLDVAIAKGWCGWKKPAEFFSQDAWFNMCLPQCSNVEM